MDISYHCPQKVADLGGRTFFGALYQSRKSFSYYTVKKCFQNVRTTDVHVTQRLLLFRFESAWIYKFIGTRISLP